MKLVGGLVGIKGGAIICKGGGGNVVSGLGGLGSGARDAHTRTDVLARVLRTPRAGYKGYGVQKVP